MFNKEPAIIIGAIGGAIIAAIQVLGAEFFPDLEPLVIQAVQVIVAVLTVLATRQTVYAPDTVDKIVASGPETPE
jgi:hypothetical protein